MSTVLYFKNVKCYNNVCLKREKRKLKGRVLII